MQMGRDPSPTPDACGIEICSFSTSGVTGNNAYIDFTKPGLNFSSRIQCAHLDASLQFYTNNNATERMRITNSGSLYIGATVSPTGTYKLYVAGNSYFGGTTTASGTKTFDIPHPTQEHHRLRHRCIESPEARLLYEFQMDCSQGPNSLTLPGTLRH